MADPFGNYLCQKLFEVMDANELERLLPLVSEKVFDISIGTHGTRSVQKLIEILASNPRLII